MPVRAALRAAERGASGPRAAQASEGSAEPGTEVLVGYFRVIPLLGISFTRMYRFTTAFFMIVENEKI